MRIRQKTIGLLQEEEAKWRTWRDFPPERRDWLLNARYCSVKVIDGGQ